VVLKMAVDIMASTGPGANAPFFSHQLEGMDGLDRISRSAGRNE
jgi:hypothetical protein